MSSVQVQCGGKTCTVAVRDGETLLPALRQAGFSLPAACGGRGRCGKCRVTVNGASRLACKTVPCDGDVVTLPAASGGAILTDTVSIAVSGGEEQGCAAAVDLGTTTVAVRLYDLASARERKTVSAWNVQASYGADVISRIQYTLDEPDGLTELSGRIRRQVSELVSACLADAACPADTLRRVSLAGNTVMQHLFAGLPVRSIAAAPFAPLSLFDGDTADTLLGAPVFYAPCVAGYVGGDVTAGLLASGLYRKPGQHLFLDLGTNGEMALGGADGFFCCAVASGPAFEGAGIACGMPALDGAVSRVRYDRGLLYDVIGASEPRGICGSGLIDLAASLLALSVIDKSGRLLPPEETPPPLRRFVRPDGRGNGVFHLTDRVYLTAEDVRSLQLAKAAVAGGIEVLLRQRDLDAAALDGVYIAGGFGSYIDPDSAMAIGMLPRLPRSKLHCLGNTALAGASMAALSGEDRRRLGRIAADCRYIELSGRQDFARAFTDHMVF